MKTLIIIEAQLSYSSGIKYLQFNQFNYLYWDNMSYQQETWHTESLGRRAKVVHIWEKLHENGWFLLIGFLLVDCIFPAVDYWNSSEDAGIPYFCLSFWKAILSWKWGGGREKEIMVWGHVMESKTRQQVCGKAGWGKIWLFWLGEGRKCTGG